MVRSVSDVAAEFRRRLPGVGKLKLHKLLYYAQGHHLATFGTPLFRETISAWDHGPVVGTLWYQDSHDIPRTPEEALGEGELNTLGYVISRYGGLTGTDLKHLTHSEPPWRDADRLRKQGTSVSISPDAMRTHFAAARDEDEDEAGPLLDSATLKEMLGGAEERLERPVRADTMDDLSGRLQKLRA